MISYGRQYIDQKDINGVLKVLKSNFLTQGPTQKIFENKLSKYLNTKYVSTVSSGTAALHLVSKALKWGKGDTVVSSPITFVAGIAMAINCGAKPDFVDIDSNTFNIDPNKLETKLKKKSIKAVIITDFAGQPADWDDLYYLKKKYNFQIVNDNCHALGAKFYDKIGYASEYADAACLSFHPVKNITTGEGGAILTKNKKIYEKCNLLRSHGIKKKINDKKNWNYEIDELGFNYRLSDINASLGTTQIDKLNVFLRYREKIALKYNKIFENYDEFKIPLLKPNRSHAYHLYVLRADFKKLKKNKKDLFNFFYKNNINLQVHYIPIFLQPYFKKNFRFNLKDFPNTLDYYEKAFSIPIFYGLSNSNLYKISKLLLKFFKL